MKTKNIITAEYILDNILQMPSAKIITVCYQDSSIFVIDIDSCGNIGYVPNHRSQFIAVLNDALSTDGSMIIRQFTNIKVQRKAPNGKLMWLPQKKVYGFGIVEHTIYSIPKRQLFINFNTDHVTKKRIPEETGIIYSEIIF